MGWEFCIRHTGGAPWREPSMPLPPPMSPTSTNVMPTARAASGANSMRRRLFDKSLSGICGSSAGVAAPTADGDGVGGVLYTNLTLPRTRREEIWGRGGGLKKKKK